MKLFHATDSKNVKSILTRGLIPNDIGIVYLSPYPQVHFGNTVLMVETGDNKLTAFEDCADWEVLCWGKIPPGNIVGYDVSHNC